MKWNGRNLVVIFFAINTAILSCCSHSGHSQELVSNFPSASIDMRRLEQMKQEVLDSPTTVSNFNKRFNIAKSWADSLKQQGKGQYLRKPLLQDQIKKIRLFRDSRDIVAASGLLDEVFAEFQKIDQLSVERNEKQIAGPKMRGEPSREGALYTADASTVMDQRLPAYVTIASFENLLAPVKGKARVGTNPVMQPSSDAHAGKTSAEILFYGNNTGETLGDYWATVPVRIPKGSLRECTEFCFWIKTSKDINELSISFREDNGNLFKSPSWTIHSSPAWQKIVVNLFGDLEIKQTSLKAQTEDVDPSDISGFEIRLPVSQAGEFKLDQIEALKRQAGSVPDFAVEPIEDCTGSGGAGNNLTSQVSDQGLRDLLLHYHDAADTVAKRAMFSSNLEETIRQCKDATKMYQVIQQTWETMARREARYEESYNYIRNKYMFEKASEANRLLLRRLETWMVQKNGTLVEEKLLEKTREAETYEITYMSDGLRVTGILTKPAGNGTYPVLLTNHGGFGNAFFMTGERTLTFVRAGYVVFAPDYRGTRNSEGRAETRIEMSRIIEPVTHQKPLDETKYGRRVLGVLHDIENSLSLVRNLPYVDPERTAILGHSMGHIASRLVVERNYGFKGAVFIAAFLVEDQKLIDGIKCPVFLAYGDGDKVAPPQKGFELKNIFEGYGKSVKMEVYAGKDHQTVIDACLDDALKFLNSILSKQTGKM